MGTNTHLHMMETALITIFAIVACTNHEKPVGLSILPTSYQARNGDVVLRKGTGLTSRAVMFADGGSDYSHLFRKLQNVSGIKFRIMQIYD